MTQPQPQQYPGIGMPIAAVKGMRMSKSQVSDALLRWESTRHLVIRQMSRKGFTEVEVNAALGQCDDMLDFYDELLEKYE